MSEAEELINEFYQNPIEPDEELTLYWNRWVSFEEVDDRVFDGKISQGFNAYRLATIPVSDGYEEVQVMHSTRKHVFGQGYMSDGAPELSLTGRLDSQQAKAVRDLLDWWIKRQGDE